MPFFSVLVVNWCSGPWLSRCLDALERQTWRDFEIIVVDNGSTDGSAAAADGRSGVTLIEAGANLGFAAGNNRAAARAGGRWLVLLNPDAVAEPDWLAMLAEGIERHPWAAVFGSTQLSWDDPGVLDGVGDAYHASGLAWRAGIGHQAAAIPPDYETFAACAAAAAIRADAFAEAGGFDESYFCYFEDVDLCFRLRLLGHRVVQLERARVRHAGSASSGRRGDFAVFHGTRNRMWTFVKDMPGPLVWPLLPLHALMTAVMLVRAVPMGVFPATWRGVVEGVRGLPAVLASRRRAQASRRLGCG
ncbi:MAG: glycosyltransferase family 2 protein, partial [Alphaproteobacteria bacterium]|nr:glycosyltransferase family 2 protein [Alphaproteobacteria bacterium]